MAEDLLWDCLPDFKELENKTGRQIPQSLLTWMKNSESPDGGWKPDVVKRKCCDSVGDSLSDKIKTLKQEMMWLRSTDVRILRQLVALHEGIEGMRWLMEERAALTSRGSSLTGSLSSLATVEEQGPPASPCRKSPTFPRDSDHEKSTNQLLSSSNSSDSNHQSNLNRNDAKEIPSVPRLGDRVYDQPPGNGSVVDSLGSAQHQDPEAAPHKSRKDGANVLRRALLRSSRERRSQRGGAGRADQSRESFPRPGSKSTEEKEETLDKEKLLLGYDAQWCWVESQDDVTFL